MKFYKYRLYIIIGCLSLFMGTLVLRAVYIQILPNSKLKALKEKQFNRVVVLEPARGQIVDRKNKELATSITAYSLFADPSLVENPRRTSLKLSKYLNQPSSKIFKTINDKSKKFVWLKRKMNRDEKQIISDFEIRGLGFVEESKRIYPNQNLLSHTLGFVGQEGQGLEGVESKFNEILSGEQKKVFVQRDARGRPLLVNGKLFTDKPDGVSIQLTIDSELQYILEQELGKSLSENEADSAVGVVMEAHSNEILALASIPDFNPNEALRSNGNSRKNRAIVDPFEPGSTLKPFVVAGSLREGLLEPNTKYYCEKGQMKVADRVFKESDSSHKFEWLTVSEILAKSSNIGMVKIGFQLGTQKTRQILEDFGFGLKTGVEIGGDSKGILSPLPWREVQHATISFGQGVAVSALQIANAYAAIANGGVLKEPLLVKSIMDSESNHKEEFHAKILRNVLTKEQAQTMLLMLMGVTQSEGTAMSARVAGFPVAGKTGTAQKVNPNGGGYLKGSYVSSFAGIIPAHDPKYVIFIAVDNPKKKYYGSEVAAPVFAKVASYAMRESGMSPILLSESNMIGNRKLEAKTKEIAKKFEESFVKESDLRPDQKYLGLTVREVLNRAAADETAKVRVYGSGVSYRILEEDSQDASKKNIKVYFK